MFKRGFFSLAVFGLLMPGTALAREPVVLAPVKPWNLHYADSSCQLFRSFGDAAKPTTLVIEQIAPDTGMTMMVYGGPLTARTGSGTAKAWFLPFPEHRFDEGAITETTTDRKTALMWTGVDLLPGWPEEPKTFAPPDRRRDVAKAAARRALEQATTAKVTGLQVTEPRGRTIVLQTGPLAKVHAMMRECGRDQMRAWGLDPATEDKIALSARTKRNFASYFSSSDYPFLALRQGQESIIAVRLIVGADGSVTRCTPLTPFTGEGFKEVVCRNLSRAVFEPAELADGTKVPTFVTARIRFEMP